MNTGLSILNREFRSKYFSRKDVATSMFDCVVNYVGYYSIIHDHQILGQ